MKNLLTYEQFILNESVSRISEKRIPFKGKSVNDLYRIVKTSSNAMVFANRNYYSILDPDEMRNDLRSDSTYLTDKDGEEFEIKISDIEFIEMHENVNENRDPKSIKNEYIDLKKMSIQGLRDMWSRTYRIGTPKELDKEGLVMDILIANHGVKYVEAAFESMNEETEEQIRQEFSDAILVRDEGDLPEGTEVQVNAEEYSAKGDEEMVKIIKPNGESASILRGNLRIKI